MSTLHYYIDLTPDRRHCAPNMPQHEVRRVVLCDDCARPIREELSIDFAHPEDHEKTQHLRCERCLKNGFGEPATRADPTAAEPDPRMAAIDRAADAMDRFMDYLDEIANPELFKDLKDTRIELATRDAELAEARKVIATRDAGINRMCSELTGARGLADDTAGDLLEARTEAKRFEAAWNQAMTELGDLKSRHDQLLRVFDGMVDLGVALGSINSELDQMRLAMFKALDAALGPDPASPNPVASHSSPHQKGKLPRIELVALTDEASTTQSGEVDERDTSTGDGEAAGELS